MDRRAHAGLRAGRIGALTGMIGLFLAACGGPANETGITPGLQSENAGYPTPPRGASTAYKQCLDRIHRAGAVFRPVPDSAERKGCAINDAVEVTEVAGIRFSKPATLTCKMVAGLDTWLRRDVQPAAQSHFGEKVGSLQVFQSYKCRYARGRRWGGLRRRLSQHAFANALDVGGMWLESGEHVKILRDWRRQKAKSAFLKEIALKACDSFPVTLTPHYDWRHRNHFHLSTSNHKLCGYRGQFRRRYTRRSKRKR